MNLPYNINDKTSILEFAKKLKNKTLREICEEEIIRHNYSGKGSFGQLLEKFYFLYEPNSDSNPDFYEVGLELKSSPLKTYSKGGFGAKERLVLNIINFHEIINQNFENSSFWKKNANLLLIFYLHQHGINLLDYQIKLIDEWSFQNIDLEIIKKDWETIKSKIAQGKAHELSEGDTFYLGACTKGANSSSVRTQPNSDIKAKQRAFSLKQGYVNHIIASISKNESENFGKLIDSISIAKYKSIEQIVLEKFQPYISKSSDEIIESLNIEININSKDYYSIISKKILGFELNQQIEEFEKANITLKTIRVEADNKIIESISFKTFKYTEIINETWENSDFKNTIDRKFLFIFYKDVDGKRILEKVNFWNIPYYDLQEVRKVWLDTKKKIINGKIVKNLKETKRGIERETYFLGKKDNRVSHVRPHAQNASDTFPLPVPDKLTNAKEYTKHCFWLNNDYVLNEIYLK